MVTLFDSWIHALGAAGFLVLALASLIEYVVPPFPGDTIVVLGGVYAIRGERSWALVFLAITLGSVLGCALDYAVGRLVASRIDHRADRQRWLGVSLPRIRELQAKMRGRGELLLLANRFLPGIRGLLFVAAGASRMPLGRVLALGTISAVAWNLLLFVAGLAVGGNAERLEALLTSYQRIVLAAIGLVVLAWVLRWIWRARRAPQSRRLLP